MKWILKEIEIGDMVRVPMSEVYHYGICTGENRIVEFGEPVLSSLKPRDEIRVIAVDIASFLSGAFAEVAVYDKKEQKRRRSVAEIVEHAEKSIGKGGYDILYNNCEHFANECVFGAHVSSHVDDVRREIEAKLPCINVYIGETEKFACAKELPGYVRKELKKISNERVAMEKKAGYGLLCLAAEHIAKAPDIKKCFLGKTGKPLHKDFYFSISHSGELVVAATAAVPIGIDIEVCSEDERQERLKELILHENEQTDNPFLLWTIKEAAFKFSGKEKVFNPASVNTKDFNSKSVEFIWNEKKYILSVVGDVLINVRFNSQLEGADINFRNITA